MTQVYVSNTTCVPSANPAVTAADCRSPSRSIVPRGITSSPVNAVSTQTTTGTASAPGDGRRRRAIRARPELSTSPVMRAARRVRSSHDGRRESRTINDSRGRRARPGLPRSTYGPGRSLRIPARSPQNHRDWWTPTGFSASARRSSSRRQPCRPMTLYADRREAASGRLRSTGRLPLALRPVFEPSRLLSPHFLSLFPISTVISD